MKKIVLKLLGVTNLLAFAAMAVSVNSTCLWIHHQPRVPKEAREYRRF